MRDNLIQFRKELCLSQEEFAKGIEISVSFYRKIETGARNPSYSFLTKLKGKYPSIKIDEFFFVI